MLSKGGAGSGKGGGMGRGQGRGGGMGRQGGRSLGTGGQCICTGCGHTVPHQRGVPCNQQQCPKCGGTMTRQE